MKLSILERGEPRPTGLSALTLVTTLRVASRGGGEAVDARSIPLGGGAARVLGPDSPRLWLDHASVAVPALAQAVEALDARLGLSATISPAAPDRHARIHLDRSYLEVVADTPGPRWASSGFFLRFDDDGALHRHLDAVGLRHRFGEYTGVDGRWDDVEIHAGSVPMPILVRRIHPPEIARDWPPALRVPHRCGAWTLEAVHVVVPALDEAVDVYTRLTGTGPTATNAPEGAGRAEFRLLSGRIVLLEGDSPAIAAIVLGVGSLAQTAESVGPLVGSPVAWSEAAATHGLPFGFVQIVS